MKKSRKILILVVAVVVIGAVAGNVFLQGEDETYEFFESAVSRGTIQNTIAATGNVEAMVTVDVGSQVTGQVQTLYADFNSVVTQGQVLARLDPRNVETQLRNSQANLRSAQSRILAAEADRANEPTTKIISIARISIFPSSWVIGSQLPSPSSVLGCRSGKAAVP